MPAKSTVKTPLGPRIRAWIDTIAPGTPEVPLPPKPRKCSQEEDGNLRVAKRRTRVVVGPTTGNLRNVKENINSPGEKELRRSPRRQPPTPAKSTNEADEDTTPKAEPK